MQGIDFPLPVYTKSDFNLIDLFLCDCIHLKDRHRVSQPIVISHIMFFFSVKSCISNVTYTYDVKSKISYCVALASQTAPLAFNNDLKCNRMWLILTTVTRLWPICIMFPATCLLITAENTMYFACSCNIGYPCARMDVKYQLHRTHTLPIHK